MLFTNYSIQYLTVIVDNKTFSWNIFIIAGPEALTTRGTDFIFAFMGNNREQTQEAIVMITTEESRPVNVTVEVNPAFYVNNSNLNVTTFPQTQTQTVEPGSSITFTFPVAPGNPPPDEDIQVYTIDDRLDRNSGIRISTDGGKVSVYGFNSGLSSADAFNIFPCHVYPTIPDTYEYVILSTAHQTTDSRFMIVGCQNNTEVVITPPSQLDSINTSVPANLGGGQTPGPRDPLNISHLDQLTTILLNNQEDLSGTKITSNKPIAVFTGHECGNVPTVSVGTCDHIVQQVPPQVTWGRLFFTVPIVGRYSGDHYRVATTTDNTQFNVTCRTLTDPIPTIQNFTMDFNNDTESGFEVFDTDSGTTTGDQASRKDNLQWCCIEANNPVLVMQYAFGGTADESLKDIGTYGDPLITIIPPVAQYLNDYTVPTDLVLSRNGSQTTAVGLTIAIPRDKIFFRSAVEDGSRILINNVTIVPDPDEGWIEIFCASGQICGYSARVEHAPIGVVTIKHLNGQASISAWIYGINEAVSFGYTAGFELDEVSCKQHHVSLHTLIVQYLNSPLPTVPVVSAVESDVTVLEMNGVAVVTFTRAGDLSLLSRFNVRLMSGSASSCKLHIPNTLHAD